MIYMNEKELINYYNKFNEDKRLNTRHGNIEFITSIKYIEKYLKNYNNPTILDIGAGTGKYSIYFYNKGYNVTSIELVKHNLRVIEEKCPNLNCIHANALKLDKIPNKYADIVILFGPLYHLISKEDKLMALNEAKRVLKDNGIIFIQYVMNEYAVITHGFKEFYILDSINNKQLSKDYHILSNKNDLYSYMRLEDIGELNKLANLKRIKIFTPDGPSNYIRPYLNKMNNNEYNEFIKYHLSTCERFDLLGAAAHIVDIVKKDK